MKPASRATCCTDLVCLDLEAAEQIRAALPRPGVIEQAAATAKALADPTRLTLLLALRESGELCVCDLTWIVDRPQNLVSHHLRKLREAELVDTRREAKVVHYALTDAGRTSIAAIAAEVEA